VTVETLVDIFSRFGSRVLDIVFEESKINHQLGKQAGHGFIHYPCTIEGINSAIEATKTIKQISVNQVLYDCSLTPTAELMISKLRHQLQPSSFHDGKTSPPLNHVFVPSSFSNSFYLKQTAMTDGFDNSASAFSKFSPTPVFPGFSPASSTIRANDLNTNDSSLLLSNHRQRLDSSDSFGSLDLSHLAMPPSPLSTDFFSSTSSFSLPQFEGELSSQTVNK
jgi:hypothetical protein